MAILHVMNRNDDVLDNYLKENQPSRAKKQKTKSIKQKAPRRITQFQKWQACAGMEIAAFAGIMFGAVTLALLLFLTSTQWAIYALSGCGVLLFFSLIYFFIDYQKFRRWTSNLKFTLEGHNSYLNGRTEKYWTHGGEYWIATQVKILFNETASEKHKKVVDVFMHRLRKRLNQWTVSEEKKFGESQPDGWRYLDYTLMGDMNPRVFNRLRKALSGEFNQLVPHMSGSIKQVVISNSGGEKQHKVDHDID